MLFEWFNRTKVSQNLTLIGWFAAELRSKINICNWVLILFYSLFWQETLPWQAPWQISATPPGKQLWNRLFKFPKTLIFFWSHFKIWEWSLSLQKGMRVWYCVCFFSIYFAHLRLHTYVGTRQLPRQMSTYIEKKHYHVAKKVSFLAKRFLLKKDSNTGVFLWNLGSF